MSRKPSPKPRFRILRMLLICLVLFVVAIGVLAYFTAGTYTRPFIDASGNLIPNAIAEERSVMLGGVEQYVLMRGKNRQAPLLVFVHGGPGASETPFLRTHNAALEEDFVVVYWEQRGAVHSYDPESDLSKITIDRLTKDLGELINVLLVEFGQEKVLLIGHSWGTVLALEHVAAHPETVASYIAISQTTNQADSDKEGYEWALARARESEDEEAIQRLEAIGYPPYTIEQFITQRRAVSQFGGTFMDGSSDLELAFSMIRTDEFSWPDLITFVQGTDSSGAALWPEQKNYNAYQRHPSIDVPIVMVMGRHDKVISPTLGKQYFKVLEAPEKELIWFENSAHGPPFEEPQKFNDLVRQTARRLGLLKSP
ncbi:alpha/beta hydrolase fold protein [Marinomonas posidonica IVIA-Po-181]|uniref:Alpha/beta hydrolase fold protein n=1 Tax=Marinomonas posidonica (strain CECT 7376 / NCIMB 14433 / IVIA-Po-181) TaxID=491952 RepID=F6CUX3_MARPP|nr:alpha/beta hydrolase fold protein [Marinomonas posidonica IVIA-Po-181]